MVAWFLWIVYLGGVFWNPEKNRGFVNRIIWPTGIGEKLEKWAENKGDEL